MNYNFFDLEYYDDAVTFMVRLRNVEPAIYNQRRVAELPLPQLNNLAVSNDSFAENTESHDGIQADDVVNNDDLAHSANQNTSDSVANDTQNENSLNLDLNSSEMNVAHEYNEPSIDFNDEEHQENLDSQIQENDPLVIVKAESNVEFAPLFNIHVANAAEIEEALYESDEDDDVVLVIGSGEMPKPLAATTDDLLKRQDDKMTGDVAFNETVSGRIFFLISLKLQH